MIGHITSWSCVGYENNNERVKTSHWSYGWTCGICGRVLVGRSEKDEIGRVLVAKSADQDYDQLSPCGDVIYFSYAQ